MSGLQDLYQTVILEEAKDRHGFGLVEADHGHPHDESHQVNPTCGDQLTLRVELAKDGQHIERVSWEGDGCSISMASVSLLSELVESGWTVDDALLRIAEFRQVMHSRGAKEPDVEHFGDAVALGGVSKYVMRVKCAMLGWVALEDALRKAAARVGA